MSLESAMKSRMSYEKTQEIVKELRRICREANVAVVIPRQVHPPARVEFPPGVDMVFGIYSPRADDTDAQIEMHVLKSREPGDERKLIVDFLRHHVGAWDDETLYQAILDGEHTRMDEEDDGA